MNVLEKNYTSEAENRLKTQIYDALDNIVQVRKSGKMAKESIGTVSIKQVEKGCKRLVKVQRKSGEDSLTPTSPSPFDTIASAREGTKFKDFKEVYDSLDIPNNKWAEILGVSERTMQNILKEKRDLDQNKSEKLLAFLSLVVYALEVLGSITHFKEWLNYKAPALKGKRPLDFIDTFQGISMLKEILFKIETGNLV